MARKMNVRKLTMGGLLTAIIALLTAYIKVVLPVAGFAHLGDGPVILAGLLMGPQGAIAAALGSALGDVLAGYAHYAPFSAVIKGVMALIAGKWLVPEQRVSLRNLSIVIAAFLWMMVAYLAVDSIFYGFLAAVYSIAGNLAQAAVGVAVSAALLKLGPRLVRRR